LASDAVSDIHLRLLSRTDSACAHLSKAFTKEDDSTPERSSRRRLDSGLPPGALNYLTADGAEKLRAELDRLMEGTERAGEIMEILASATIVQPPAEPPGCVVFGARVELRGAGSEIRQVRIVGAGETELEADGVSWLSPLGKKLLGLECGEKVTVDSGMGPKRFAVVRIWWPLRGEDACRR
jgi:transcription elongation GreA/GreB family factor